MKSGIKHLIKCNCILSQFMSMNNPPFHNFVVFSILQDDNFVPHFVQCNNCDVVHKVIDVCKSEILTGKESTKSILSVDDIKSTLPTELVRILLANDVDYATWSAAKFIIENESWGERIVMSSETNEGLKQGKYIVILSKTLYKIDTFSTNSVLS